MRNYDDNYNLNHRRKQFWVHRDLTAFGSAYVFGDPGQQGQFEDLFTNNTGTALVIKSIIMHGIGANACSADIVVFDQSATIQVIGPTIACQAAGDEPFVHAHGRVYGNDQESLEMFCPPGWKLQVRGIQAIGQWAHLSVTVAGEFTAWSASDDARIQLESSIGVP